MKDNNILDPLKYKKAKRIADNVYKTHSAYKNQCIYKLFIKKWEASIN